MKNSSLECRIFGCRSDADCSLVGCLGVALCSPLDLNSKAAGVALGGSERQGDCALPASDGQGVCASLRVHSLPGVSFMAAAAVRHRIMAATFPVRSYYRNYYNSCARDYEQKVVAYANALLAGHINSRLVRSMEAPFPVLPMA